MSDYRLAPFDSVVAAERRAVERPLRSPRAAVAALLVRAGEFRTTVPAAYVGDDAETGEILVSCACEAEVRIASALTPTACSECPRWFLYDGKSVRVARSPVASRDSSPG